MTNISVATSISQCRDITVPIAEALSITSLQHTPKLNANIATEIKRLKRKLDVFIKQSRRSNAPSRLLCLRILGEAALCKVFMLQQQSSRVRKILAGPDWDLSASLARRLCEV